MSWSQDSSRLAYTARYDPSNPDDKEPAEGEVPRVRVTRRIDFKRVVNETRRGNFKVELDVHR